MRVLLAALLLAGCAPAGDTVECVDDAPLVMLDDGAQALVLTARADGVEIDTPRGVFVLFHGLGETACTWWDRAEGRRLTDMALAQDLVVVAPDSGKRSWATSWPENDDVDRVDGMLDALVDEGAIPGALPAAALGHSNGGAFAPIWAESTDWSTVAAINANGWGTGALGADASPPPLLFVRAVHDLVVPPGVTRAAAAEAESNGHVVTSIRNTRQPISADRLGRIRAIDRDQAAAVVDGLDAAGLLDGMRRLNANPRLDSRWRDALPDDVGEHTEAIEEQLHVLYAEHRFTSDNALAIFDLVNAGIDAVASP